MHKNEKGIKQRRLSVWTNKFIRLISEMVLIPLVLNLATSWFNGICFEALPVKIEQNATVINNYFYN